MDYKFYVINQYIIHMILYTLYASPEFTTYSEILTK